MSAAFGFYQYFQPAKRPPFECIKLTRLTNSGKVARATLSADGKFIAYVLDEADGNSLWVRQTGAANDTRILPSVKDSFWGLTFKPDATEIYYTLFSGEKTDPETFRIPTLGGAPRSVPNLKTEAVSFSPDGKRIAFVQSNSEAAKNYLLVAGADGSNARLVAEKPYPETFVFDGDFTACAPDGKSIVFQRGILAQPRLWKVSIDGGSPAQFADFRAKWAALSADGSRLSYLHMKDDRWRIGFLAADGKPSAPDVAVPANLRESEIYWSADERLLYYVGGEGNTGNVWALLIADGQAKPVTNLKNQALTDFALAPDGKKLALARKTRLSDVVLISEVK